MTRLSVGNVEGSPSYRFVSQVRYCVSQVFVTQHHLAIVMEYAAGGDLSELIDERGEQNVRLSIAGFVRGILCLLWRALAPCASCGSVSVCLRVCFIDLALWPAGDEYYAICCFTLRCSIVRCS